MSDIIENYAKMLTLHTKGVEGMKELQEMKAISEKFQDDIDDDDSVGETFKGLTEEEIDEAVREYSEEVGNKKILKHWKNMKKATLTQKKHNSYGQPNLDLEYGCRFYFQFNAGGLKASMTMQFGCGNPRDTYSSTMYMIKSSKYSSWKKVDFNKFKKHKAF